MDCPNENSLLDWVEGRLPELAGHAAECTRCREILARSVDVLQAPPELPAADLSRYEIDGEVAQGGIGRILRARDRHLGRWVALKLPKRPADRARFAREALVTARLQHPAIVPLYEAGLAADGTPFYAMKLVEGRTLKELIDERRSLPARLALLPNVLAAAEAVAYAHGQGVIHRDLKPANLLVGELGETVVIDWGLGKDLAARGRADAADGETVAGEILGTPGFMPPEQAAGEPVDERADVYALGALLYQLLAGAPPYPAGRAEAVLAAVRAGAPIPVEERERGVPPELAAIVGKAMARAPAERYPTARDLADDLRRYLTGQLVSSHAYSPGLLVRRWLARHRPTVVAAGLLLVALAATGLLSIRRIAAARRDAEARRDALVLAQAASKMARDPTAALAWLQLYPTGGADWDRARDLLADAESAGVARALFRDARDVAAAPTGGLLAIAERGGGVRLWDPATGIGRELPPPDEPVDLVAFTPDARTLVGAGPRTLWRWDVAGGARTRVWRGDEALHGDRLAVAGRRAARSSGSEAWVWDLDGGPPRRLHDDQGPIWNLELGPGGRLVTASNDGSIRLWDAADKGRVVGRHVGQADDARFAPDGTSIASSGEDHAVRIWPLDGRPMRELLGHTGRVFVVRWLGDGRLVSIADDQTVRVWPAGPGAPIVLQPPSSARPGGLLALAVSADGRRIAAGGRDETIHVWDLATGGERTLVGHEGEVRELHMTGDGRWLVSWSYDGPRRVWDLAAPLPRVRALPSRPVRVLAVAGRRFAVAAGTALELCDEAACIEKAGDSIISRLAWDAGGARLAAGRVDGSVEVWTDGDRRVVGSGNGAMILGLGFRGTALVAVDASGRARAWDAAGAASEQRLGAQVTVSALSDDGALVAAAGTDSEIALGFPVRPLRGGHADWVSALAFAPDGRSLVSASIDGSVTLWDLATTRGRPLPGLDAWKPWLLYAPDGRIIAGGGGGGAVQLWDPASGAVRALVGHTGRVAAGAFAPDGRLLVTGDAEGTVEVWDLATGARRALRGHGSELRALAFTPDGELLVSVGRDGRVVLWSRAEIAPLAGTPDELAARMARLTTVRLDADDRPATR